MEIFLSTLALNNPAFCVQDCNCIFSVHSTLYIEALTFTLFVECVGHDSST